MAVKVDVGFGDNQGVGIRTSIGAPQALPISARVDGSAGYWWKNGEIPEGWMFTYGYELGISPSIIVGSTKYVTPGSPEFNQRTGHARIGIPGFNIKYENDGVMWFLGDNGDRYRTAAAKVQLGPLSLGINLFTGDPGFGNDRNAPKDPVTGKKTYIISKKGDDPNKYSAGIGYIGIGSFRFGNNKESRRHYIQNEKIHGDKYPWFTYDKTRQNRSYFQFGTGGGYLW